LIQLQIFSEVVGTSEVIQWPKFKPAIPF